MPLFATAFCLTILYLKMLVPSTNDKSRKTTQRVCDPRERETGK